MTKEQYRLELSQIKREMQLLKVKETALLNSYRSEHRKFGAGDKVKIKEKMGIQGDVFHEAYVLGCGVHDNGDLYYQFNKAKKDGSKSSHRLYLSDFLIDDIELIEKAK